ncbi:hypothetical protein Ddye_029062 [Dipteronia dyeriana]|uniref:Glycine-rich protein n=1 Tax=Dipteronia dyeriana TaxID=168575 RepID=A0AAD9TEI0_9ROSI|nr:hypothetical protein Ddye_029062 [Dipteronia dyeriana]
MGFRKLGLLIMFFTFLHMFESSSPLQKPLYSESFQDIQLSNEDKDYGRSSVINSSKIARGGLGGASGGKSTGSGESTGNNGGSSSPSVQGGTAVIPVYAGGAASNRHPNTHRGAGNSNHKGIGLLGALILTALTSLVHLYGGY